MNNLYKKRIKLKLKVAFQVVLKRSTKDIANSSFLTLFEARSVLKGITSDILLILAARQGLPASVPACSWSVVFSLWSCQHLSSSSRNIGEQAKHVRLVQKLILKYVFPSIFSPPFFWDKYS